MTTGVIMGMTLSGDSVADLLVGLRERGLLPAGRPERLKQGVKTLPVGDDWFEVAQKQSVTMSYGDNHNILFICQPDLVQVRLEGQVIEPAGLLEKLAQLPFELASFTTFHHVWGSGNLGERYYGPSFGKLHSPLGWGCAFRGAGHNRLVSRRWLDFAPWRTLRTEPDTTLLQFFDLNVDAITALAQARIGHERLIQGFLPAEAPEDLEIEGLYSKEQRALIITTKGRPLDAGALRVAAMVRHFQSFGKDMPIDNVVYVFVDEGEAQQHLEAMWLHGFEVRLIGSDGQERRIDEAFEPRVERPAWAG